MNKNIEVKVVPLSQIEAQADQPRRQFDADKIASLAKSIKRLGIKDPIVVTREKTGKYLIVNGERRFRAAKQLGLTEVPIRIEEPMSSIDRLVEQFHLQEQQLGWTPVEKANAIAELAETLKISDAELADLLQIPHLTIRDYLAFSSLLSKKVFEKSSLGLSWAKSIRSITRLSERLSVKHDIDLDKTILRKNEESIIGRIRSGELESTPQMSKIRDIFTAEPKMMLKFYQSNEPLTKLFAKSKADSALHARNVGSNIRMVISHWANTNNKQETMNIFMEVPGNRNNLKKIIATVKDMEKFIN